MLPALKAERPLLLPPAESAILSDLHLDGMPGLERRILALLDGRPTPAPGIPAGRS